MARMMMVLSLLICFGCAALPAVPEGTGEYSISNISEGLPTEGLWRQNIALVDMNKDGVLDIVAPPPRKAVADQERPFIFIRDKDGKWKNGNYTFPRERKYAYGGVAAGDLNGDGYPDIVLAVHSGKIILLQNDGKGGFIDKPFPLEKLKDPFQSRTVQIADVNGDGRPDIVALSDSPYSTSYSPQGLLIGINKGGGNWDLHVVEDSLRWFGDSFAIGDITGAGKKDIAVATLAVRRDGKRIIYFGDGKGDFKAYDKDIAGWTMPIIARAGDLDGAGKDEVVLMVSTIGRDAMLKLSVFKWTGSEFKDMSSGLEKLRPLVFDLADLDGDGMEELVVLAEDGIHILKYASGWHEQGHYAISADDTKGARDLRVGKNRDGSFLIVYNLGDEGPSLHHGIRAFLLKK
jgi:hypothetical protein